MSDEGEIIRQAAGLIADALGGWKVDTDERWTGHRGAHLDGPGGARLTIGAHGYRNADRLEIAGSYPQVPGQRLPYGTKHHTITVSRDRGPAAIARDVRRRLLPPYAETLAEVCKSQAQDTTAQEARDTLADRLGGTVPSHARGDSSTEIYLSLPAGLHGRARVNYRGDSASLELGDVPADLAIRVLDLLRAV